MEDSKEEESITTTKTSLPLPPALKTKDVPKTKGVLRDGRHSVELDQEFCRGVKSFDEVNKGDKNGERNRD